MTKEISCLIVEDEPLAVEVLKDYISQIPYLKLAGTCSDALFALEFLQEHQVDVMFLDIHLPRLKGLDFLRTLKKRPAVIITTAYHEYALEGYELEVLDYLLKPIEFSRFLAAINKLQRAEPGEPTRPGNIFVYVDKKKVKVRPEEILYIESMKEYVKIHLATRAVTTKMPLSVIEEMLDKKMFLRIHRSFIVAVDRIDSYSSTAVDITGKSIPVGRNYRESVQAFLG
jgi:DNA-binding LytR/AlgR family response regulator